MLTNFSTVYKRLQRLKELEELDFGDVAGSGMTKKELLGLKRERDKLDKTLGGIRDMARVPSAIWVVDTKKEHIAVNEARKLGIPVVAILDTNCDPDEVTYPIPGNDDAIRSVALLTRVVADAVADGLISRAGASETDQKPAERPVHRDERRAAARVGARPARGAAAPPRPPRRSRSPRSPPRPTPTRRSPRPPLRSPTRRPPWPRSLARTPPRPPRPPTAEERRRGRRGRRPSPSPRPPSDADNHSIARKRQWRIFPPLTSSGSGTCPAPA